MQRIDLIEHFLILDGWVCHAIQNQSRSGQQLPCSMLWPQSSTWGVCMSLSMPRGPRVVLIASTSAMQALMLLTSCALPWLVSVPSLRRMIWGCCSQGCFSILSRLPEHKCSDADRVQDGRTV